MTTLSIITPEQRWRFPFISSFSMGRGKGRYNDIPGFCKSVTTKEIASHGFVLTPGRYVGAEAIEEDDEPFDDKMKRLFAKLEEQFSESAELEIQIRNNSREFRYNE